MGIMLFSASHWFITAELCLLNVLENIYFLCALSTRSEHDLMTNAKSKRILLVLLARELAEVMSSCQYFISLLCMYLFNPDRNKTTQGLSAARFTQGAVYC